MTRIELINSDLVTAQLLGIPQRVRTAIEKEAVKHANTIAVSMLRQSAPVETGALRKSFKYDIRTYKGGSVVVGLAGVDKNYVGTVERNKKGKKVFKRNPNAAGKKRRPAKYLHLVELGTKKGVTGTHFVQKTAEQLTPQFQQILTEAVEKALS